MSVELRASVNKVISAFNDGNFAYIREAGPDILHTYSTDLKRYEEVADVLDELLFIFDACELKDESYTVSALIGALPKPFVLPPGDTHFEIFTSNGKYQETQRQAAYNYIEKWGVALDIGGHVGFWANDLATRFEIVHSFEPNPETFKCLMQNKSDNVSAYRFGVGDAFGSKFLSFPDGSGTTEPANSGGWEIADGKNEGTYCIEIKPLDSLSLEPDFIKIDVQGYELQVLLGARETIMRHRPVIMVELVANGVIHREALDFIENNLGMVCKDVVNKDYVFGW